MFTLPDLPYPHDALEPVISETTLRIHHGRHHAKYVETVNELARAEHAPSGSLEQLIRQAARSGEQRLFNNAAQAWNHAFFWDSMAPRPTEPGAGVARLIEADFGKPEALRAAFLAEATSHFGSGWAWLAFDGERLAVFSTHDADTMVTRSVVPLLVCDVWEHAYYLDHKNDRAGFVAAWWDRLANWDFAERQLKAARGEAEAWRYPAPAAATPA